MLQSKHFEVLPSGGTTTVDATNGRSCVVSRVLYLIAPMSETLSDPALTAVSYVTVTHNSFKRAAVQQHLHK